MNYSIAATNMAIAKDVLNIKRTVPVQAVTVIAPDLSICRSINRALLTSGKPLLNVRIETFYQHVDRVIEQQLINEGIENWTEQESRLTIQQILEEGSFDCFLPAREFPSYSFFLHKVIRELRTCLPESEVKTALNSLDLKGKELWSIFSAYIGKKGSKADYADKLSRYQGTDEIIILFPELESRLSLLEKNALHKNREIKTTEKQISREKPEVSIRNPLHQTAEVKDTLREILSLDTHLDRVAIIAPPDYLPLVFREAGSLSIPVYCPYGEELHSAQVELFCSVLDILETDYEYQHLKNYFQLQGQFSPIHTLIKCGVAKGGSTLSDVLERKLKESPEPRFQKLKEVLASFGELEKLLEDPHELGQAIVRDLLPESMEKNIIRALLLEIEAIDPDTEYGRWRQLVDERTSRLKTSSTDRNRSIYLTTSFQPGDFDTIFVLGLKGGNFPARFKEDPILLDDERKQINGITGGTLITAEEKNREQMRSLALTYECTRKKWVGSFPSMNLISGDEESPSFFLIDVVKEMTGQATLSQEQYDKALKSCSTGWIPDLPRCLDYQDWAAYHLFNDRTPFINHILGSSKTASAHYRAHLDYWSVDFNESCGFINKDGQKKDAVFSATQLEGFMTCPYKWFVDKQLGVKALEEPQSLESLEASTLGTLLHKILESYMLKTRGNTSDLALMQRMVKDAIQNLISETGDAPVIYAEKLESDLTAMIENLFQHTIQFMKDGRKASYFELSFGMQHKTNNYQDTPVELTIGDHRFKFAGSIDRVDTSEDKVYIVDYKSSKAGKYKDFGFDGGRLLQPALYSEALMSLKLKELENKQIYSGYLPLKDNNKEFMKHYDDASREKLKRIIDFTIAAMSKGFFFATGNCDWCDYGPICGSGIQLSSERKLEHALKKGPFKSLVNEFYAFEEF